MSAKSPPSSLQAWWAIWEFHSQHELRISLKVGLEGWQPLWGLFLISLFPASPCPSPGDPWGCRMGGISSPHRVQWDLKSWLGWMNTLGCVWGCTAQLPPRGQDWDLWQRAGAATAKISSKSILQELLQLFGRHHCCYSCLQTRQFLWGPAAR